MSYKIITPPVDEPISLEIARLQCRIDGTDSDATLALYISGAREQVEAETGRATCTQTRELVLDSFPEACVLRGAPIQSVESVKYIDPDGTEQTLDPQDYLLDAESAPGYLLPGYGKSWPATRAIPNAVRVRYVCGYGGPDDVPASIKAWMLLHIAAAEENKSALSSETTQALANRFTERLLDPHRVYEAN